MLGQNSNLAVSAFSWGHWHASIYK